MMIYPIVQPEPVQAGILGVDGLFASQDISDNAGADNWTHQFPNLSEQAAYTQPPVAGKTNIKITEGP